MAIPIALLSAIATAIGNIALSERQANRSEANVDKQNEYNLPVNQIQRLKDAGINPVAGSMQNGMSVSGNTSSLPQQYQLPNIADPMSVASNSMLAMANAQDIESTRDARINKLQAEAAQARANAESLGVGTAGQLILNEYLGAQQELELSERRSRIQLNYVQSAQIRTGIKKLQNEIYELLPEQIKNLQSQTAVNELNLPKILAEIADLQASAGLRGAQTEQAEAETNLAESENLGQLQENLRYNELTDRILAKYDAEVSKLSADTGLTKEQTYYYLFDVLSKWKDNSVIGSGLNTRRQRQIINTARNR